MRKVLEPIDNSPILRYNTNIRYNMPKLQSNLL